MEISYQGGRTIPISSRPLQAWFASYHKDSLRNCRSKLQDNPHRSPLEEAQLNLLKNTPLGLL